MSAHDLPTSGSAWIGGLTQIDRPTIDWVASTRSAAILAIPVLAAVATGFAQTGVFVALGCFNVLLLQFVGTANDRLVRSLWGVGLNAGAIGLGTLVGTLGWVEFPLIAIGLVVASLVDRIPRPGSLLLTVSALFVMGVGFPGASVAEAAGRVEFVLVGGALALAGFAIHMAVLRRIGPSPAAPLSAATSVTPRPAPRSHRGWAHAVAVGVVAATGFALALGLGLARDYWVMLTVVVVLRAHFGQTFTAGAARMTGTVVGATLAVVLTWGVSEPPLQGLLIVGSVFATLLMVSANYTLYSVALTVFVILLINLAYPGGLVLAETRVLDTVLGGALAMLAGAILWSIQSYRPRADRPRAAV
ncbi:MAG: FUSC family protein [Thermoplasmata archaeon]